MENWVLDFSFFMQKISASIYFGWTFLQFFQGIEAKRAQNGSKQQKSFLLFFCIFKKSVLELTFGIHFRPGRLSFVKKRSKSMYPIVYCKLFLLNNQLFAVRN